MLCLPKELSNKIKQAIRNGEINPNKLIDMTSSERRSFLAKIVGEKNAKDVNLLFEKKLLLKNQERGIVKWAEEITGISKKEKEALLEKIRKTYEEKKNRVYDPKENENFLNEITSDAYAKKYKTEVSLEEAQTITEMAQAANKAKSKLGELKDWGTEDFKFTGTKKDAVDFASTKVALDNYIGNLKLEAQKTSFINPLKEKGISAKLEAVGDNVSKTIDLVAQNSRALVASFDNSLWGRQGLRSMLDYRTNKIWKENFKKSWDDIAKIIKGGNKKGDAIIDAAKAEIYSRENYMKGRYERGKKLDIGTGEEAFPTTLPSKILVFGRGFRASEVSYEAGAMRLRADIADKFYSIAEKNGIDLTSKAEVGAINQFVNSMTGRGSVPTGEKMQKNINNIFFSIKYLKSEIDFLTAIPKVVFKGAGEGSFARKQAAINVLSTISSVAVILKIAQALNPDDNKDIFNSTSSNFGKVRSGNMTFDITAGIGGFIVMLSRILTQSTTNATTGITTKLGEGYGARTGMNVFWDFTENKLSPMFSVIRDLVEQKTFERKKPTLFSELKNISTPIIFKNVEEFKGESDAMQMVGLIADGLGISANAYSYEVDWGENTGKELQQFKEKAGEAKFKEANDLYNKMYNEWLIETKNNDKFMSLSDEEKQRIISSKKSEIKQEVFKEYIFKYKPEKPMKLPKF